MVDIWETCQSCAEEVYGRTQPSKQYAGRVANLLLGTLAHESHFQDGLRRQIGNRVETFDWYNPNGGWSLAQVQTNSIENTQERLKTPKHSALANRSAVWLFRWALADPEWLWNQAPIRIAQTALGWDRLAVLLARLHYIWRPEPVPQSLDEQANYWKIWYNTKGGKGNPTDYLRNWIIYARPAKGEK